MTGRSRPSSESVFPRLIDAGIAIVRQGDPAELTIERVCQVANVSRATFYRRWNTITPILEGIVTKLLIEANPQIEYAGDLRTDMLRCAHGIAGLLSDPAIAALFRHLFAASTTNEDLRHAAQALDRRRNAPLIALLSEAQRTGRVTSRCRPDYIAYQVFGPIWHRTLLLQFPPTDDFIEAVVDTVLASILPVDPA
ncbi:hypothetical protein ASF53_21060 [Methylobacterium sp. Leaf123]|nr:hypothetical protein ASF53_21060 [Methylobacterium sp. Leaf123]